MQTNKTMWTERIVAWPIRLAVMVISVFAVPFCQAQVEMTFNDGFVESNLSGPVWPSQQQPTYVGQRQQVNGFNNYHSNNVDQNLYGSASYGSVTDGVSPIVNPVYALGDDGQQSDHYADGGYDLQPEDCLHFPRPEVPRWAKLIEFVPTKLSKPVDRFGCLFGRLFCMEHDEVELGLDDHAIGIQPIPERPRLILELNEHFLAPGFLNQGIETRHGAIWRPSLWVFGEYRTSFHYYDRDRPGDHIVENVHRLDLFAQLNLSGTERILAGFRPLDEEEGGRRPFTGYDFRNGDYLDAWNANLQTLFFEGDFGELFPLLDPFDSKGLDIGFSVGRMPLLAQQGLLINEDMIDAVTVTRNTLNGRGNLNLRMTGVFSWRGTNRNSAIGLPNDFDPGSKLYAFLTESDFACSTVNIDGVYVDGDEAFGDLFAFGVSSIRRHHLYENTYNSSLHLLASFPGGDRTAYADQGELLFSQLSWTPHHTEDLIYLNSYWAIDQFTSPARGPAFGNALGQTGILFGGIGLGSYGAPIAVRTDDTVGTSLGYQMFFDHTRSQVIWELGGVTETKGPGRGAIASALRVQKAFGQHLICILDGFVSKPEARNVAQGARMELRVKF